MAAESIPTLDAQVERPLRKTERTRLRLVEAVRAEIESTGGFTAELVARRAETSPATFYNHFANKDDALAASFTAVMRDLVAHVEAHLRSDRLLEVGLEPFARDWLAACLAFFRANSSTLRSAQAQVPASNELRRIFRDHEAAALEHYVRFVELAQNARVVREGDAPSIAHALMIQNEGWNHPAALRPDVDEALLDELAGQVVRHLAPMPTTAAAAAPLSNEGTTP